MVQTLLIKLFIWRIISVKNLHGHNFPVPSLHGCFSATHLPMWRGSHRLPQLQTHAQILPSLHSEVLRAGHQVQIRREIGRKVFCCHATDQLIKKLYSRKTARSWQYETKLLPIENTLIHTSLVKRVTPFDIFLDYSNANSKQYSINSKPCSTAMAPHSSNLSWPSHVGHFLKF